MGAGEVEAGAAGAGTVVGMRARTDPTVPTRALCSQASLFPLCSVRSISRISGIERLPGVVVTAAEVGVHLQASREANGSK